jgi:cation:H+ antiporter
VCLRPPNILFCCYFFFFFCGVNKTVFFSVGLYFFFGGGETHDYTPPQNTPTEYIVNEYLAPGWMILAGFVVLIAGGEVLVRGAAGLARIMRVSPLVIGLTVVAFCTSTPELAVVLRAAASGQTDLAVGNVVGSCICNVLFVLGLSALVAPLVVSARLVRLEVPLMIGASVAGLVLGLDGQIDRRDGMILFAAVPIYAVWSVLIARRESSQVKQELAGGADATATRANGILGRLLLIAIGVGMLGLGSNWLIDGSVTIAEQLGVSQLVIGLTILALGTSLPEVATCIIAAFRGHYDLAVGNVVGSNILNILAVLGLPAIVAPKPISIPPEALTFDIPVMIAVSAVCLPIFITGWRISRREGFIFLTCYGLYIGYLVMAC